MKKRYSLQCLHSISNSRKWLGIVALAITFALCGAAAEAQQPNKVARICFLGASNASTEAIYVKPFRERLREIGYVEEQNLTIEYRFSEGKVDRLPDLAVELVRLNCDVSLPLGLKRRRLLKK